MKIITLFCFSLLTFTSIAHSQEVISAQGDSYNAPAATIDFTIGETIISTLEGNQSDLTQGFHQTLLIINDVEDLEQDILVKIFPNPTSQTVTVQMDSQESVILSLYDMSGRLLEQIDAIKPVTHIDLSSFTSTSYLLVVLDKNSNQSRSFKILKQK